MNKPQLRIVNVAGTIGVGASGITQITQSSPFIPLASFGDNAERLKVKSAGTYIYPNAGTDDNHISLIAGGGTLDLYDAPGNYLGSLTIFGTPTPPPLLRISGAGYYMVQEQDVEISAGVMSNSTTVNPGGVVAQVQFTLNVGLGNNDTVLRNATAIMTVMYEITTT